VNGGGEKDNVYIGNIIRWYYSTETNTAIRYIKTGNQVPKSEGAKPLMDLPPHFPSDVDFDWYVSKAEETLEEIGFKPKKQASFF
jgi:hypothetical protein